MSKEKKERRHYPFPDAPFADPVFGQPESCADLVNKYGTYNIQPTADTENVFPLISHALPEQWKDMAIGKDELEQELNYLKTTRSDEVAEHRTEGYGKLGFFLMLNVGLILTAVAMVLFKTPNHLAFGGTTGVAIVLGALFPQLPVSSFMWVLNVALVILGFVFLDRKAMIWSSFASIALSAYVSLFEWIFPVTQSITGDLTLDVCFAVLLPALGSALVFDIGASTGGTDILAMILRKRTDVEIGKALFAVDIAIVCAAAVIYGPRTGLWCILGLVAKTFVVDTAIESIRQRKVCQVICKYPHEVEEFIVRKLGRTATVQTGWGAYSGRRVIILTTVLTRREAMELRLYVRGIDRGAFITITSSSEIIGRGFRGIN